MAEKELDLLKDECLQGLALGGARRAKPAEELAALLGRLAKEADRPGPEPGRAQGGDKEPEAGGGR